MERQHHATVELSLDGRTVAVDAAMAEIIEALWDLGIRTRHCCQGNFDVDPALVMKKDFAYIMFDDIDGLRAFLELFEGTDLAARRAGQRWDWADDGTTPLPRLPRAWMFDAGVHPPRHDGELFVISGTVRFPPSDIQCIWPIVGAAAVR